jgi:DNA-binding response OmpR family regulator
MKILVVVGSSEERHAIVGALLKVDGVVVRGAVADLASALRVLAGEVVDIVITGVRLADGDGMQVIEAVRASPHPPWIVVAGPGDCREVWLRYLQAGADRYVELDRDLDELREVIGALVGTRRSYAQAAEVLGRMTVGAMHDIHDQLCVLGVILKLLQQAPTEVLWADARATIARATGLTAKLLDDVRRRQPAHSTAPCENQRRRLRS